MPFTKGKSGNPVGRPKKTPELREVEDLAKDASPEAIKRLIEWIKSDEARPSITACIAVLDRAFGKPAQAVEHKGTVTHDISSFSDAELAAIIAEEDRGNRSDAPPKRAKRLH